MEHTRFNVTFPTLKSYSCYFEQNSDWLNPIWTGIKNNNRLCIFFQHSERTDGYIARSVVDISLSLKSDENKISITIALRNNNLNNKAIELKSLEACKPINIHCMTIQFIHKIILIKQRQENIFSEVFIRVLFMVSS